MPAIEITVLIVVAIGLVNAGIVMLIARRAERRNPPIGKFIEIDGLRLHYLECGDPSAPAVVLFHGNGAMIQDFTATGLVDRLANRYRVICFDRPGFGYSGRPLLRLMTPQAQARLFAKALERLDVQQPILFGHSWGTLVALALALHLPQVNRSVKGLVLAAGYYFPTMRWDVIAVSFPAIPLIGDIMCYTISPVLSQVFTPSVIRSLFAPNEVSPAFERGFPLELSLRPSQLRATAQESAMMIPSAARLKRHYRDLSCPLVVLGASGDEMVEVEQAPRLQRATNNSALRMVDGVGHMLHYEVPDEIVRAIDKIAGLPKLADASQPDLATQPPADPPRA